MSDHTKFQLPLAYAQAFLFVPANKPERFEKALATKAQGVIIDLEDAVPPVQKAEARENILRLLPELLVRHGDRIVVRINAFGTECFDADLAAVSSLPLAAVMLPKAESAEQLDVAQRSLASKTMLIPMIESAKGIDQLKVIASHPKALRLTLGNIDLQSDLGFSCGDDELELLPLRYQIAMQSRLAEIAAPIDGVTVDIHSAARLAKDVDRSKRIGFMGKLCIHPNQIDGVIAAFRPSAEEVAYAQRVIAADEGSAGGAVQLDGRMIDRPVVLLAKRTMQLATQS